MNSTSSSPVEGLRWDTIELAPDFPENRLNLIETLEEWGESAEARRQIETLESVWATARKKWIGPDWEIGWPEWQKRLEAAKRKTALGAK